MVLGLLVASIRPRRRANLAFALFSGAFGMRAMLAYAGYMLGPDEPATGWLFVGAAACAMVAIPSLVSVALAFPRPLAPQERRLLRLPVACSAAWTLVVAWAAVTGFQEYADVLGTTTGATGAIPTVMAADFVAVTFIVSGFFLALLLLALRYAAATRPARALERRQYLLMSAALVLYPGVLAGGFVLLPVLFLFTFGVAAMPLLALLTALWLRNGSREGPEAAACRNMALACLAAALTGMVFIAVQGGLPGMLGPQHAIGRTLSVLLFAYAIVRHQLLGIDIRLKRTLRHSTVATVFIGIFLLGSEVTRALLGEGVAPYMGIVAAAALLLAFTRVQRLAESVAEGAMPHVRATPAYLDRRKLEVYRAALQASLTPEGSLPEKQAAVLARLRAELGITDRDHAVLEHAVRAEGDSRRPETLEPGRLFLGRYRVARALQEGGHGATFLCRDELVDRDVAIKGIRSPEPTPEGLDTVLREARAIGAIRHPNVVTLHDVQRVGDEAFIIMEYLDGGSLAARLQRGPLADPEFRAVAEGTLRALEAVHAAGMVHRDVKPSNILLARDGQAKLADFGIAHIPGFETTAAGVRDGTTAVGTIRYMSPEQALGRRVAAPSDLFSAAATCYEAYTGQPYLAPREGESAVELQMRAAAAGSFDRPVHGPPALRAWFAKALHPSPERRFAEAAEMRRALDAALDGQRGRARARAG